MVHVYIRNDPLPTTDCMHSRTSIETILYHMDFFLSPAVTGDVVNLSLLPESQSTNKKYDVKHEVMMSNSWLAYNVSSLFGRLLGA